MRLDQLVFEKGMAPSREKAHAYVMAGDVYLDGVKSTKPGKQVREDADLEVRVAQKYVSRGGFKLEKALQVFDITVIGKTCIDVGASTGGFTDCLLQNGAARVYSVDVGYGQLDWGLRNDPRVVVMERTNIRKAAPSSFDPRPDFFTVDVSFISLSHIFVVLKEILLPGSQGVCLIKPQFEAGREQVGKNGVVRDAAVHSSVIEQVAQYAIQNGFCVSSLDYSPIKGPKGNIEYIISVTSEESAFVLSAKDIEDTVNAAHNEL